MKKNATESRVWFPSKHPLSGPPRECAAIWPPGRNYRLIDALELLLNIMTQNSNRSLEACQTDEKKLHELREALIRGEKSGWVADFNAEVVLKKIKEANTKKY